LPSVGTNLTEHPFFAITFDLNIKDDADPWGEYVYRFCRSIFLINRRVFINTTVTNEAIQLWNTTRSGPLATIGRLDQIVWARVPPSTFTTTPDPSSGFNSAHYELGISVSSSCVRFEESLLTLHKGTSTSLISGSSIVSPASRKIYDTIYPALN